MRPLHESFVLFRDVSFPSRIALSRRLELSQEPIGHSLLGQTCKLLLRLLSVYHVRTPVSQQRQPPGPDSRLIGIGIPRQAIGELR